MIHTAQRRVTGIVARMQRTVVRTISIVTGMDASVTGTTSTVARMEATVTPAIVTIARAIAPIVPAIVPLARATLASQAVATNFMRSLEPIGRPARRLACQAMIAQLVCRELSEEDFLRILDRQGPRALPLSSRATSRQEGTSTRRTVPSSPEPNLIVRAMAGG